MESDIAMFPAPRKEASHKVMQGPPRSRTRSILYLIIGVAIFITIFFCATIIFDLLGYHQLALGLLLITTLFFWVSVGVGLMLGLTYFVMHIVIRHEFKRRYERNNQSRRARMHQMTHPKEPDEESG